MCSRSAGRRTVSGSAPTAPARPTRSYRTGCSTGSGRTAPPTNQRSGRYDESRARPAHWVGGELGSSARPGLRVPGRLERRLDMSAYRRLVDGSGGTAPRRPVRLVGDRSTFGRGPQLKVVATGSILFVEVSSHSRLLVRASSSPRRYHQRRPSIAEAGGGSWSLPRSSSASTHCAALQHYMVPSTVAGTQAGHLDVYR